MTPSGSMAALKELILLRVRSFLREPEALFWTFGFPILMAIGLGLAFRDRPAEPSLVGVERGSVGERYADALRGEPDLRVTVLGAEEAARKLRRGEVALVLAGTDSLVFRYDPARPESQVARLTADRAVQAAQHDGLGGEFVAGEAALAGRTWPLVTLPLIVAVSSVNSKIEPFSPIRMFSEGTPTACARRAWAIWCRYSPCTGMKKRGRTRLSISFCSSWKR